MYSWRRAIATSTGQRSNQYWSLIGSSTGHRAKEYWSDERPVLVTKLPEYGLYVGYYISIYYLYRDERIRLSALAEDVHPFLML